MPDDCDTNDWFGVNVEIAGDYALVTSRYDDNEMGQDAGAVYIFKREGNNWLELDKLMPADSAGFVGYEFCALYEDNLVVGAYSDDAMLPNAGSAYLYLKYGDTWIEVDRLYPDDLEEGDQFGSHCAIFKERIAIGANSDDDLAPNSGACYVYRWNESEWYQEMKITAADGDTADQFGTQVDLYEEYMIVGSRYNDELGVNSGAVYVYQLEPIINQITNNTLSFVSLRSYPNPFDQETIIEYEIQKNSHVRLYVVNMFGQIIKTLVDEYQSAGKHYYHWNGILDGGLSIPAGQYVYQIIVEDNVETIKTLCID